MTGAKLWIRRIGVLFMLLLMLGTLLSFGINPLISDARTRKMLGDPDAYVTDTRRSPWISIDPEGNIRLHPEKMIGKKTLVIPDAVNGIKVTGKQPIPWTELAPKVETIVFPKGFSASSPDGQTGIFWFGKWESLEVIVFAEGAGDLTGVGIYSMPALKEVYLPKSATGLYAWSFKYCGEALTVYYSGTEEEWEALGKFAKNVSQKYSVVFNTPVPEYYE